MISLPSLPVLPATSCLIGTCSLSVFVFLAFSFFLHTRLKEAGAGRFREKCYLTFEKKTRGAGRKPGLPVLLSFCDQFTKGTFLLFV